MSLAPRPYTAEELEDLIACPKTVSEAPRQEMKLDQGHWRNDMRVRSVEGDREFRVFVRRSEDFPESFSIGLAFLPKDGTGEVVLLRCNGQHGGYNETFDPDHPHWDFHVHKATAEMIQAGLRPEKAAEVSREFGSFEEALQYFLRVTNIRDGLTYFPEIMQRAFRFEGEPGT